jgi:hypothetical protein
LDPSDFFWDHATPILAVLSSITGGVGAWLLSRRNIDAILERAQIETNAEVSAAETAERTAFRAMLMAEVAAMRQLIKECDADKEALHERLNAAMAQSLVLRATVEIMEKRVAFSRQRHALCDQIVPPGNRRGDVP